MSATTSTDERHGTTDHSRRGGWEASAKRLLAIAGLCALSIAQPTLDVLGESPATFQVNRLDGSNIVVFAVIVVVVPPLLLWLVGEGAIGVHLRAGLLIHLGIVAILCGLFGILATKELGANATVNTFSGVTAAVVCAWSYGRFKAFGSWIRLLSAANLLFFGQFVFIAPVSDLISGGTQEVIEVADEPEVEPDAEPDLEPDESRPSVLMLIFDEWPTQSIFAEDETVDEVRFPNLASFADDATWYRHFTTVSPFTQSAVPALLDGLDPHGEPNWNDHPESLFSLLAPTHHLIVSESITQLCGLDGCGVRPVPPPIPFQVTPPTSEDVEVVAAPGPPEVDTGPRWRRLTDTAWEVWTNRVRPGQAEPTESYDDFEEEISIVQPDPESDAEPEPRPDPDGGLTDDQIALERFFATQVFGQPDRLRLFVDALRPTDEPFLGFLHLILPHQPWSLREDGTSYDVAADRVDFAEDRGDPWPVKVTRQRHLLQAEYTDRLLGIIINRLKEIDEYDDTLIVVVSDHGVAFGANEPSRSLSETNLEQIAYAPLLIKAPGQTRSEIDDSNINSTDVTPTIADMLDIELSWETDGSPAGSDEITERDGSKYIYSFTDAFDYTFLGIVDFDDDDAYGELVAGRFPAITTNDDRLAGLYRDVPAGDLIGQSPEAVFGAVVGDASVVALEQLLDPDSDAPLLGEIAGQVGDPPGGSTVVVAVNDRIVGVSYLYRRSGEDNSFVVLLPNGALSPDRNTIRLGLRHTDGTIVELAVGS